jgi:hypothetical protein
MNWARAIIGGKPKWHYMADDGSMRCGKTGLYPLFAEKVPAKKDACQKCYNTWLDETFLRWFELQPRKLFRLPPYIARKRSHLLHLRSVMVSNESLCGALLHGEFSETERVNDIRKGDRICLNCLATAFYRLCSYDRVEAAKNVKS